MALNPPVSEYGIPIRLVDEYFLLERKGIEIEIKIEKFSKLSSKGKLYLSSARLCFVNKDFKNNKKFVSFDIPFTKLTFIDFKQPFFGANYWFIKCNPLHNLIPGKAEIKLYFMEGGCQRFLESFQYIQNQIKDLMKNKNEYDNNFNEDLREKVINFSKNNYYDPNDPTVIYSENNLIGDTYNNNQSNNYYGNKNNFEINYPENSFEDQNKKSENNDNPKNDSNNNNEDTPPRLNNDFVNINDPVYANNMINNNNNNNINSNQYYYGIPLGPKLNKNN